MGLFRRTSRQPQPGDPLRPAPTNHPTVIEGAGAAITTQQVLDGQGRVRFLSRGRPRPGVPDNGWRVFGEFDSDDYVADTSHLVVVDYNRLCALEPALIGCWDLPVGSELEVVRDRAGVHLVDSATGRPVPTEALFVPEQHRGQ